MNEDQAYQLICLLDNLVRQKRVSHVIEYAKLMAFILFGLGFFLIALR